MTTDYNNNKTQKHADTVAKIITLLQTRGPTLPIHISTESGLSTLFANAFLSELLSKKTVRTSNMRIGSSPLYYLPGQEEQLLNFIEHIKGRERDALELLKKEGVVRDENLEPAIRVAMRSIRDFAFPLQANMNGTAIIFWRFLTVGDNEAKNRIREMFEPPARKEEQKDQELPEKKEEKKEEREEEKPRKKEESANIKKEEKNPLTIEENEFYKRVREQLEEEGMEVSPIEVKKKDLILRVRVDTKIGKVEFLAVGKEKKKISEVDLTIALQRAQNERSPCLFVSNGELNNKAKEYLESWKNMIKYKNINFK
jgi:hypothetical protein